MRELAVHLILHLPVDTRGAISGPIAMAVSCLRFPY